MKHKVAICTCIKDEREYLAEWIEYHLSLGFDHIFLYEDYDSLPHIDIASSYDRVTLMSIDVAKDQPDTLEWKQRKMYTYSIEKLTGEYDWIAFIDADEFIEFGDGYSLDNLLDEYAEEQGIILAWRLYTANGRIERPTGGVIDSYPIPDDEVDYRRIWGDPQWCVKSFANLSKSPKVRHIHLIEGAVNMNGNYFPEVKVFQKAWIRHYYTKSWEEWVYRIMKRGDLCNGNRKLSQFFNANTDMVAERDRLMLSVADQVPKNCYILDGPRKIIAGSNVRKVKSFYSVRKKN